MPGNEDMSKSKPDGILLPDGSWFSRDLIVGIEVFARENYTDNIFTPYRVIVRMKGGDSRAFHYGSMEEAVVVRDALILDLTGIRRP